MADEIEYEGLPANAGLGVSADQKKFIVHSLFFAHALFYFK